MSVGGCIVGTLVRAGRIQACTLTLCWWGVQAHSFELLEPLQDAGEGGYKRGGLVTQVKEPKQLQFRTLAQVLCRRAALVRFV